MYLHAIKHKVEIIFIDECPLGQGLLANKKWQLIGSEEKTGLKGKEKHHPLTLLSAVGSKTSLHIIVKGSINSFIYNAFLEELSADKHHHGQSNYVIMMDNCPFHRST